MDVEGEKKQDNKQSIATMPTFHGKKNAESDCLLMNPKKSTAVAVLALQNKELKTQMQELSGTVRQEAENRDAEERRKVIEEGIKITKKQLAAAENNPQPQEKRKAF